MTKITTTNMFDKKLVGPLSLDLQRLQGEAHQIASDWNGESARFMSGGDVYTEDKAHLADEIDEKITELLALLEEANQ